jgi:outer membrane protein OmpA-like peptidoglycan-associated protein
MTNTHHHKKAFGLVSGLILFAFTSAAAAETVKVEGFIAGRSGDEIIVKFGSGAELAFKMTDRTKVSDIGELHSPTRKSLAMAALIPGLKVKVEGVYNDNRQVLAKSIKFKSGDLEDAKKIQAGMHELRVENQQQQEELDRQNGELQAQRDALQKQQEQVEANKANIEAAVARFGQLDDYYIIDEVTLLFGNGKVKVDPQYEPQLLALADKAKAVNGYVLEVRGHASSSGSAALNQKLSENRAKNVTNILLQKAHVPLTRLLAPGALGEAHQVASDERAETEAANRRVVVRVLQNKAVAGI